MRLSLVTAPFALIAASGAIAADMLPLTRGIYVNVGTRCQGASNADTLSYWGGNNGINGSKLGCKITRLRKQGASFSLHRRCKELTSGGSFDDRAKVTVLSRTSFIFHGRSPISTKDRKFRYCGPKVQF